MCKIYIYIIEQKESENTWKIVLPGQFKSSLFSGILFEMGLWIRIQTVAFFSIYQSPGKDYQ